MADPESIPFPIEVLNAEKWAADGSFVGADGRLVSCKDDVILSRTIAVQGGHGFAGSQAPPGTVCTVLFYSKGPIGLADLECYPAEGSFTFGHEKLANLTLHRTAKEKWPD